MLTCVGIMHVCPCVCIPGDYYLVRSASGDFVVQVRQFYCNAAVTCNRAIRIRYGSSVIGFDSDYR